MSFWTLNHINHRLQPNEHQNCATLNPREPVISQHFFRNGYLVINARHGRRSNASIALHGGSMLVPRPNLPKMFPTISLSPPFCLLRAIILPNLIAQSHKSSHQECSRLPEIQHGPPHCSRSKITGRMVGGPNAGAAHRSRPCFKNNTNGSADCDRLNEDRLTACCENNAPWRLVRPSSDNTFSHAHRLTLSKGSPIATERIDQSHTSVA